MTYYSNELLPFYVDGALMFMTEEEAEEYQDLHPLADVTSGIEIEPLTLQVDDDIIDCTCKDEQDVCPACEDFFRSLL